MTLPLYDATLAAWLTPGPDNARLIVAAPVLLKACAEAVREMRDSLACPSNDWDCFDKLCAAIAKATGEQP